MSPMSPRSRCPHAPAAPTLPLPPRSCCPHAPAAPCSCFSYAHVFPCCRLYSEMSVCPLCPWEAICTVRCPYAPYVPGKPFVQCDVHMSPMSPGSRSYSEMSICPLCSWRSRSYNEMSICPLCPRNLFVQLDVRGHRGHREIRTSHCTNSFPGT